MPTIRPERPADIPGIHALHISSFPTDAEARLVDALRATGHLTVSLVAEFDGVAVGHITFSPVTVATGQVGVGLAPIAVLESDRRRGIAAELVRAGIDACRAARFGWAVVLGEPAYYSRFGFRPASEFGLIDEYGGGPAFQALELSPGGLPRDAGLVKYGPEFAAFG
jgi:putative acetyltransferase